MKEYRNGLITGLSLQLAVGPVFFYIINLAIQRSIFDGFAGALAVACVDLFYITLSVFGIGKILESKKFGKAFGIISSLVLTYFGIMMLKGALQTNTQTTVIASSNILTSFASVFLITISSPMTIVFFTSLFTAKALEYKYTQKELFWFGMGTGSATFLFMGSAVILFSFVKTLIPAMVIAVLNGIVGVVVTGYGVMRLWQNIKKR